MSEPVEAAHLLVLNAVRLAGVADVDAVLDRTFMADTHAERLLAAASATGWVEPFAFGDSSGWILTDEGAAHLARLIAAEAAERRAGPVLEATLESFEPINDRFVELISRWQLRSTSPTSSGFTGAADADVDHLLGALTGLGADLRQCVAPLTGTLPRFGRYPVQYAAALERAHRDGLRWVTGTGLLSCHVVWAELHQDLLAGLGRGR